MSLLLDALKKAAEQKLQKEETSETELDSDLERASPDSSETAVDYTVSDDGLDKPGLEFDAPVEAAETDKTDFLRDDDTQLDQTEWRLEDATEFNSAPDIDHTEFADSSASENDFQNSSDDTVIDNAALGINTNTDTGGLQREWQAFSNDAYHATESSVLPMHTTEVSAETYSLTKNIEQKKASFEPSANQAAYMFANKHSNSGEKKRKVALYSAVVCGVLALSLLYGYDYLINVTDDSANYRPIRPSRPMQLNPETEGENSSLSEYEEEVLADSTLLVDQENYADLLDEDILTGDSQNLIEESEPVKEVAQVKTAKPKKTFDTSRAEKRAKETRPAIQITKRAKEPPLQAILLDAYDAYQAGKGSEAEALYQKVIARDHNNRDALLGLGALALQESKFGKAERYYNQILVLDPRDTYAIAGLDSVKSGQASASALSESQLKRLLAEQPKAHELHFSLGNLLARQKKWSSAQKSYFSAYRLDSNNPDYLFNLAVSLDHLSQKSTAAQFYSEAIKAASLRAGHFDLAVAEKRLKTLSTE